MSAVARRTVIDAAQERQKDGGGHGPDVVFVPRDVGRQGHRHQDADPRAGPVTLSGLLGAEGTGAGGESVLLQVPGEDPEAPQVQDCFNYSDIQHQKCVDFLSFLVLTRTAS